MEDFNEFEHIRISSFFVGRTPWRSESREVKALCWSLGWRWSTRRGCSWWVLAESSGSEWLYHCRYLSSKFAPSEYLQICDCFPCWMLSDSICLWKLLYWTLLASQWNFSSWRMRSYATLFVPFKCGGSLKIKMVDRIWAASWLAYVLSILEMVMLASLNIY